MISFFANIFGYVLNFIYLLVKNYGIAIILFSILLKLILLPMSIKQQKTMRKTQKMQGELKKIQDKYKNNPEQLNVEIMNLYKRENMSPFSGCLNSIIQIILLLAMFYLVRQPLTYMKKIDAEVINKYAEYIKIEQIDTNINQEYQEISIIKYVNSLKNGDIKTQEKNKEEIVDENIISQETEIQEENLETNLQEINDLYIEMDFLGLDLSNIPKENYKDFKVLIIPILYVISSIISINLSTRMQKKMKESIEKKEDEEDPTEQMNKSMLWMMPFVSVMISLVAPLGLALYWLVNNVLMILERIILDKILDEEENKNA